MSTAPQIVALKHSTRSQIFNALFSFLKNLPPPNGQAWKTFSQWVRDWDEIDATKQPCVLLQRGPQTAEQSHAFGVTKWKLRAFVWIYFRTDSYRTENTYPDMLTDPMIDSVEQLFQTEPLVGRQTLSNTVYHVWIDGTIYSDPGLSDSQAVIVVPLSILI